MSTPEEISPNPQISPLNNTTVFDTGLSTTVDFKSHFFKEQNAAPYNSVGVRYNRFLASNGVKFERKAFRKDLDTEYLVRFNTNLDFSSMTERELSTHVLCPTEDAIPVPPTARLGEVINKGTLKDVVDLTKIEGDDQEFLTNLVQRNFLQFDEDGQDTIQGDIKDLDSLREEVPLAIAASDQTKGSDFLQSFFVFDYSDKLQAGDFVRSAHINLTISAHFGERTISSAFFNGCSSLLGPLHVNPRRFEVVRVTKDFPISYVNGDIKDSRFFYNNDKSWSTYFGTGFDDVDRATNSVFVIDEPMKRGQTLRIDITNLLQDAIDNRGSILRFALRPVHSFYHRYIVANEIDNGVGNHWFEFERDTENRPHVTLDITPSKDSTSERLARLRRGEF
jgi:hypothetical protein